MGTLPVKDVVEKKVDGKKEVLYSGEFRLVDSKAVEIQRDKNGFYAPINEDQISCLEYQVKQGRVSKKEV